MQRGRDQTGMGQVPLLGLMQSLKSSIMPSLLICNTDAPRGDGMFLEEGVGLWNVKACMTTLP